MKRSITNNATTLTSASSSSATDSTGKYEVFLSFRGPDTRHGFTDFLYTYLVGAGIRTFRDDNELRIGEEIGPDLLKAIKDSKISIPIFSKNYAYSKWCLRELEQMVECQRSGGKMIFPIFYDVEPSVVRNQKGSYEEAFRQHEKDFDEIIVKRWKDAMTTVGKFTGWELNKATSGYQGELVKMVVEKVVSELKKNYKHVPDNLVGIDHHVEEMERLLDIKSNGVRIVGIHGMGGIGKTTISKAIYNQLCDRFECCCFLEDVRERSNYHNGIVVLQKELVSKFSRQQSVKINNAEEGLDKIKDVVSRKKVLLVVDDINDMSQFEKLVGKSNHFGVGSRIIVTTRNKDVLDKIKRTEGLREVYKSYEPRFMTDDHSLQLFSKYAFKQDFPPKDYNILSKDVVSTASGLPLTLETIGSLLFGEEDKSLWEETLRKLKVIPHKEVLDKLKISYETLDHEQKQIFLDIACFFIGEHKEIPYYMWDDCELYPRNGIDTLIHRSLVKVGDDNTLRMHDQLRDLGRQIVREENLNKSGERSRLWHPEEALDVLNRNLGTYNVAALNLDLKLVKEDQHEQLQLVEVYEQAPKFEDFKHIRMRTIYLDGDFKRITYPKYYIRRLVGQNFSQLPNLRFLRLGYAYLDGDFKHLFTNLRWLEWTTYNGKFLPTNLYLKNLVILDLSNSHITDEWEGWTLFKAAIKLKVLNLSECSGLIRGPNFSMFTTLEVLNLQDTYLRETNPSLRNLINLRDLDLWCCKLPELDCSKFKVLESLNLSYSVVLLEVTGLEWLEFLTKLKALECSSLTTLGDLSNLKKLKELEISCCGSLTEIQGLEKLDSLELLDMMSCISIVRLPDLSRLRMLRKLILRGCKNLYEFGGLQNLKSLEHLDMTSCSSVTRLPDLSNLGKLRKLLLNDCTNLHECGGFKGLESLKHLDMTDCSSVKRLPDLSNLGKLRKLLLNDCTNLHECGGFKGMESLEDLNMTGCSSLKRLPDLSSLGKLKKLLLKDCSRLREIECLKGLVSLELLEMTCCKCLARLPDMSNSIILKELILYSCIALQEVASFGGLESLEILDMRSCQSIERLPDLSDLGKLKKLDLSWCSQLRDIEGFGGLVSLENLQVDFCYSLGNTLDFSNLKNLKELIARNLDHWKEIRGLEELKSLQVLDIRGCSSLEKLPKLSNFKSLKKLFAFDIKYVPAVQELEELKKQNCRILLDKYTLFQFFKIRILT